VGSVGDTNHKQREAELIYINTVIHK